MIADIGLNIDWGHIVTLYFAIGAIFNILEIIQTLRRETKRSFVEYIEYLFIGFFAWPFILFLFLMPNRWSEME